MMLISMADSSFSTRGFYGAASGLTFSQNTHLSVLRKLPAVRRGLPGTVSFIYILSDHGKNSVTLSPASAACMMAAAVVSAGVGFIAVLVVMVVAVDGGIKVQRPRQQGAHCLVRAAADTAVQLDVRRG